MKLDNLQDEHITYLLGLWHAWSKASGRAARGYARVSCGFGGYRTSRQYDDANGALDAEADQSLARAVDDIISRIPDPWRTALHVEARNIDAPARVWRSARLAHEVVAQCMTDARAKLWEAVVSANLI